MRVDRGRNDAVAVSSLPLRREVKGKRRPVDLSLQRTKKGLEPETALVPVTLPAKLSDGFVVGRGNLRFFITGAAPSDASALIAEDQRAVYAEALPATDVVLAPSTLGASLAFQLKGRQSPETFRVVADLPRGATLRGVGKSEESAEWSRAPSAWR